MNSLSYIPYRSSETINGVGPLGQTGSEAVRLGNLISAVIGILTIVAAIWFVFIILTSALTIVSSGSDSAAYEGAKKRLTNGLIGLLITMTSVFLINLVVQILDIEEAILFTSLFTFLSP